MERVMALRQAFTEALKGSMKAGDAARTSTLRMILARVKDIDIAARPSGVTGVADSEIEAALRGMVKQRREAAALYVAGGRPELAAREEAEIGVIEEFLPRQMAQAETLAAIDRAVAQTGAGGMKDMGRVMAALKAAHGSALDMALVNRTVRRLLSGEGTGG